MSGRRNSVPVAGVEVDDEMIFEMEEDEVVRENASGEAAHSARCSVCRANFAVCSEHKVLRRRRRGRRSRVLCDDCRSTCDGSHDRSDDGSSKDGGQSAPPRRLLFPTGHWNRHFLPTLTSTRRRMRWQYWPTS